MTIIPKWSSLFMFIYLLYSEKVKYRANWDQRTTIGPGLPRRLRAAKWIYSPGIKDAYTDIFHIK